MVKVDFNGKAIPAQKGELLSAVLMRNGIAHAHPCGGRGVCRKCTVLVDGKEELSCRYAVEKDITVISVGENIGSASCDGKFSSVCGECCFVLDIGSTTLALALISLESGEIHKVVTRLNPQRAYGADVISRLDYCRKNSFEPVQKALINELNNMAEEFENIKADKLYVAGNTTMLHLFLGVDPSGMGVAPYVPSFLQGVEIEADKINISFAKTVITLPNISAFVGADIVAGINLIGLPEKGKYNLLMDLGTNAEIVLLGCDRLLCTSAAAGPCFEGANIACGMPAQSGAIYSYNNGKYKTVEDKAPIGICGTGLVDIIAELLEKNIIDETGYMECEQFEIAENVYITQEDVRQFQLAKSAILSAVQMLIRKVGIDYGAVDKLYISGGFSVELNAESASRCGLIVAELKDKAVPLSNSSLLGTVKYALEQNDLSVYTDIAEYIDLSMNPDFSKLFMENMEF